MLYIIIPLSLIVAGTLLWAWWEDRTGRDPVHSIDSFHRALSAMQPEGRLAPPRDVEEGVEESVIDLTEDDGAGTEEQRDRAAAPGPR